MGALAPLNLLVILNAQLPDVMAEVKRLQESDIKAKFQQSSDEEVHVANEDAPDDKPASSEELVRSLASQKQDPNDEDTGDPGSKRCLGKLCRGSGRSNPGAATVDLMNMPSVASDASSDSSLMSKHGAQVSACMSLDQEKDNCTNWPTHQVPDGLFITDSTTSNSEHSFGQIQIGGSKSSNAASGSHCECKCPCKEGAQSSPSTNLSNGEDKDEAKIILVMSHANIATLTLLTILSLFGAIYLWKILTRKRCTCRICQNQYRKMEELGSGGYGSVYRVDRLSDGEEFVAKFIPIRDITEVDQYSLEAKELITLRHKHIVSYEEDFVHVELGAFEPKTFFIIVMEYCPEGDLKGKIEHDFANFTEDYVRTVFAQLLDAVQYLHSKNVIHRDLKSQNVFLAQDGRVRLGDFGLCKHTRAQALGSATLSHAGTDCYMAPEMLSSSKYGKPADVWSLGCVLFEMLTGVFMWELDGILGAIVMKDSQAVQKLLKANVMPPVGNAITALLKRLLSISPTARPSVTDCIRKKIFKRGYPLSKQYFGDFMQDGEGDGDSLTPVNTNTKSSKASDEVGNSQSSDEVDGTSEDEDDQTASSKRKRRPRKKRSRQHLR